MGDPMNVEKQGSAGEKCVVCVSFCNQQSTSVCSACNTDSVHKGAPSPL